MQVFSCEYCEIFKKTYFQEHMPAVASEENLLLLKIILSWPLGPPRCLSLISLNHFLRVCTSVAISFHIQCGSSHIEDALIYALSVIPERHISLQNLLVFV